MNVLILKHAEIEGPGLIENFFVQQKIPYHTIDLYLNTPLPKPQDFTHIVILGGPMNVYEENQYPFLRNEDLFIKEAIQRGKSILGICLGAQLIAKALGAKVFKAPIHEVGWYDVSLTKAGHDDPLFSNFPKTFSVFQWHEDTFDVPNAAKLMATSSPISHQAFRYGENAYGLQFHLEVTGKMIEEWMKTWEEEHQKNEISAQTEMEIESYKERGMKFFAKFFKSP